MTVDELLHYAAFRCDAALIEFQPSKFSRMIRRAFREGSAEYAQKVIDKFIDERETRLSWAGFDIFAAGHADPVGEHAARNVDLERAESLEQFSRDRRVAA
ncbi:hypothetical protein [Microbacterium sp. E-13]|uniref:hypothetical protein n=1 Tax=Microbacterium sp. E-13 TaxID=3404048 RepID=UPI003CEA0239